MTLLAQIGYGRSDKVQSGLQSGSISGAILSPRDEDPERLTAFASSLRASFPQATILFDPQFYAATLITPRDQYLAKYSYYGHSRGLSRTQFKPKDIDRYVGECLQYQTQHFPGLSYQMSPTVLFDDFRDSWSQIALTMAEASIDNAADPKKLLISLAISEQAFRSSDNLDEFLDTLSALEVEGFYILIGRTVNGHPCHFDPTALHNIMYLSYVLGEVNGYKVFFGYTDWYGLLLEAAGASAVASGWYQNLRNFSMTRFMPTSGFARRPRKRYPSAPLLSSPLFTPELEGIHTIKHLPHVLSGIPEDRVFQNTSPIMAEGNWTDEIYCLAHWQAISKVLADIRQQPQPDRIRFTAGLINRARSLFSYLDGRGILFDGNTGPRHLESWGDAIQAFEAKIRTGRP